MYWLHQIKNNIKGVKSFTKSWQSVFTSLHYFPERRPSYTFNFLCAMLVTLILKTLVNTGVSTKTNKKSVLQLMSSQPQVWLVSRAGFGWSFTGLLEKNTKLCLNTPKLKGGTLQQNILHTWCHHTPWIQMEGEKRERGWIITLLYLLCWGSWAVVACLALMRVKVVSGPTAHSGATVEYRVVECWAVVLWTGHDDLPGLL